MDVVPALLFSSLPPQGQQASQPTASTMKLYRTLFRQARALIEERLDYYSQFNPSPLSMQQFTDFGEYLEEIFVLKFFVSPLVFHCLDGRRAPEVTARTHVGHTATRK